MEFVFIRHGQGEHTLDIPDSLHIVKPELTKAGEGQARSLREEWPLSSEDIIVTSPTTRTLQTASIWSQGSDSTKYVTPWVGPRMFPQKQEWSTLPCDRILEKKETNVHFPDFHIIGNQWKYGINTIPEGDFEKVASQFIEWCKNQEKKRVFVVTHDGTMTSYRAFLRGEKLTRDDFPKEIGWMKEQV